MKYSVVFFFMVRSYARWAQKIGDIPQSIANFSADSVKSVTQDFLQGKNFDLMYSYTDIFDLDQKIQRISLSKALSKTLDDLKNNNPWCVISMTDILMLTNDGQWPIQLQLTSLFGDFVPATQSDIMQACKRATVCFAYPSAATDIWLCYKTIQSRVYQTYDSIQKFEQRNFNNELQAIYFSSWSDIWSFNIFKTMTSVSSLLMDNESMKLLYNKWSTDIDTLAYDSYDKNIAMNMSRLFAANELTSPVVQSQISQFINNKDTPALTCEVPDQPQNITAALEQIEKSRTSQDESLQRINQDEVLNDFLKQVDTIWIDRLLAYRETNDMLASTQTPTPLEPSIDNLKEFDWQVDTSIRDWQTSLWFTWAWNIADTSQTTSCMQRCEQKTACASKWFPVWCQYYNLLCKAACLCDIKWVSTSESSDSLTQWLRKYANVEAGIRVRVCLMPSQSRPPWSDACLKPDGTRRASFWCYASNMSNTIKQARENSRWPNVEVWQWWFGAKLKSLTNSFRGVHIYQDEDSKQSQTTLQWSPGSKSAEQEQRIAELNQPEQNLWKKINVSASDAADNAVLGDTITRLGTTFDWLSKTILQTSQEFNNLCVKSW